MRLLLWFLPPFAWAFTGSIALRARRQRPVTVRRVLRAHRVWHYSYLLAGGLFLVVVILSVVVALQDALEAAVVLFLFYSALAFLFVEIHRFGDPLISPEGVFRYPDIVRWQDVADIRDTRWRLSLRLRRAGRMSISKFLYRVTNEDVQFIRQLAKEASIASGASIQNTGGREVPRFEAVVSAIARILTAAAGLLALLSLLYWLLLR